MNTSIIASLMGALGITGLVLLGVVVLLAFYGIGQYNGLVKLRNRFRNAFAQIDVQLKRRHDLIPNLVETAKAYLSHEKDTLEAVIKARNAAEAAREGLSPDNAAGMEKLMAAEGGLGSVMGRLFALSESYPDLKANENMKQLSEELTSTENKVAYARQGYNDSVMVYNTKREVFPSNIIAGMFNFNVGVLFEVTDESEREVVKVDFS
ncbi:LemA family protein [Akkermansiaceae bacterium]|nr:LemA family protein [Akkermansiaceae bacterium]MDB4730936.1 LemA family protein [Akkermansiaceae bacterium]MDB4754362.1 LemA family protein [Akkermansiaceae bacterium]MDB4758849.1 LemA family protein [Akkermansiaceae bacterium]MDC0270478.1 LemA family protein [bacterium]